MSNKHQEHIVCITSDKVAHRANGYVDYTPKREDVMLGQRAVLEKDDRFRQLLAIAVLVHEGKVWAYRRAPSSGESRLVGKVAIAVGGHFDAEDVIFNKSLVDIEKSIEIALRRELDEEVDIQGNITNHTIHPKALCADDTPVDRLHMAIINFFEVDSPNVMSKETQLETIGFLSPEELLDNNDYELESWAKYICILLAE
jgi:predicted NUDIX family phosphoesterase